MLKCKDFCNLHGEDLVEKYEESLNGGRKSIPYDYIKDNGVVVERGFAPRLAYLKAVDKYYFKKKSSKKERIALFSLS